MTSHPKPEASQTQPVRSPANRHTGPYAARTPPRTSGLAIASLILSFPPLPLVGLILGIIGMVQVKRSAGALKGYGLALAGTIISSAFMVISMLLLVLFLTVFGAVTAGSGVLTAGNPGIDLNKEIPFKCKACSAVVMKTLGEL